jgi:hypothetical protein
LRLAELAQNAEPHAIPRDKDRSVSLPPRTLHATEPRSGLDARFTLLDDKAPEGVAFLRGLLAAPREIAGIHAMWTGPEISCPVPFALVPEALRGALPVENGTIQPQPGEIVLSYVPPRMWGGGPDPVFDIGLFYGAGARLLFPIGWLPGSVVARIAPEQLDGFARACGAIRRTGACTVRLALEPA